MSPLQTLIICLCLLLKRSQSGVPNTWDKATGPNGEDIWFSTSWFRATNATSYGTIKVGQLMVMQFDWRFRTRVNTPTPGDKENYFRIGHTGSEGGCSEGTRYPSMWLTGGTTEDIGLLDISVTSGSQCDVSHVLTGYGNITRNDIWASAVITIDFNTITFNITGGGKQNYSETWQRAEITKTEDMGVEVPIWFGSDGGYNIGTPQFKEIRITSSLFTFSPTAMPTETPTTAAPTLDTFHPSTSPTNVPSSHPTLPPSSPPTHNPTSASPTMNPTTPPTTHPSLTPTQIPSVTPTTNQPSIAPTSQPTNPTAYPTINPTPVIPTTANPSVPPTQTPSVLPSQSPSSSPTESPTVAPTLDPSGSPSAPPSVAPSDAPTATRNPTTDPTISPSRNPTLSPVTAAPTTDPSTHPTEDPSITPSRSPTTQTNAPSASEDGGTMDNSIDAYSYLFYGAIALVCVFLIVVAMCCYCKFKPPKEEVSFNYDVTGGHTKDGSQPRMRVAVDEAPVAGSGAMPMDSAAVQAHGATPVHDASRTETEEIEFNESDEDVLKGAYGGHIKGSIARQDKRNTHNVAPNTTAAAANNARPQRHSYGPGMPSPHRATQHAQNAGGGVLPGHRHTHPHVQSHGPRAHANHRGYREERMITTRAERGVPRDLQLSDRGLSSTVVSSTMDDAHHDINQHYYNHHHGAQSPERGRGRGDEDEVQSPETGFTATQTGTFPNEEEEYEEEEYEEEEETENNGYKDPRHAHIQYQQYDNEYSDEEEREEEESSTVEDGYEEQRHRPRHPQRHGPYIKARHAVDNDQHYLVESMVQEEHKRKVKLDQREAAMHAMRESEAEYADQINHAAQQSTLIMDDIIQEMRQGHGGYTPNYDEESYPKYHQ